MENKLIYEKVETVPDEAQKQIKGGRLNGMTDIKPMWRIEKLTEVFGPCGLGWYAPITNREIIEGANNEKIAIVDINLFVNYKAPYGLEEDLWSEPITGTGGSSFVAKEKNGLYTSDECFKMAYTDALSVACKSLGMGAKVYWGDSKYNSSKEPMTLEKAKEYVLSFGKHKGEKLVNIPKSYTDWCLESERINDEVKEAIKLIYEDKGIKILTPEEQQETMRLMLELDYLFTKTGVERKKVYNHYKVSSNSEMTLEQLKDAIEKLKKKVA